MISRLTRSGLRSRKRMDALSVAQSHTGEKILATCGPTIGFRVSLSFSVTTKAADVATSRAATSAAGANLATGAIVETWGRGSGAVGTLEVGPGGADHA